MGRFHVWTLVWIIVLLWVLAPIVDTDKTKLRATHRHRHHRHRKPPKHHPPSVKKNFSEKYPRKINMTKIWLPAEKSTTLLSSNSSYRDNETITTLANFSTIQKTTDINLFTSTDMPSTLDGNSSRSNDASGLVKDVDISTTKSMKSILENPPEIPTGSIVGDAVHPVDLSLQPRQDETTMMAAGCSKSDDTFRKVDIVRSSVEQRTNLPEILMDTPPTVQLVRKIKRSIPSEQVEATDERWREPTLLNFNGPSIANDAEEVLDRESSNSFHKRVKRYDSENEAIPSNYLQKLEDSFPLSALEIEAREARDSGSHWRTSRQSQTGIDSSPRQLSRPKRDAEDYKNQNHNNEVHSTELKKISSADYVLENENVVSVQKIDENDNRSSASSRDLLSGRTDRGDAIVDVFESAGITAEGVEQFSTTTLNNDHSDNSSYNVELSKNPEPTEPDAANGKTDIIHVDSSSPEPTQPEAADGKTDIIQTSLQLSDPDNFTAKNDVPITGNRFEKTDNEENTSSSMHRKINDLNVEIYEEIRQPEVVSVPVDSSLKDDSTVHFRYGHDDVYPEIVDYSTNPSSIVRLVRVKRFGDRSSSPEAKEVSYESEVDNSKVAEEPYAEDNRIIDSILSKVDYRSGYESKRSGKNDNEARLEEEEISSPTGVRTSVRNKRGVSFKRTRKKGFAQRHGTKKRKKSSESLKKKHHRSKLKRSKIKREFNDPFEGGTKFEWNEKFDSGDENFHDRRRDAIGPEVISPHDGRRRRMSEEENDENFYPILNEGMGYTKDIRDSGVVEKNSAGHGDEDGSGCVERRSKLDVMARNRKKRDSGLQQLKDFQNIRETKDEGQNRSGEVDDKRVLSDDVLKGIRDIEQIVEQILAKVNELHGHVSEVSADSKTDESQEFGTASSAVDRVTSANGSSPRPAAVNVERKQPETCRQNPAPLSRQSGPAKSNGRSTRNLRAQRCSKKARRKRMSHRKWDRWTDWSSCSVTCGRGRQIRWRHCIRNCSVAETEMEEKACQLPACAPGKFLGIFG